MPNTDVPPKQLHWAPSHVGEEVRTSDVLVEAVAVNSLPYFSGYLDLF